MIAQMWNFELLGKRSTYLKSSQPFLQNHHPNSFENNFYAPDQNNQAPEIHFFIEKR